MPNSETSARSSQQALGYAHILDINRALVGTWKLKQLTERIVDFAVALSGAERGAVLLMQPGAGLRPYSAHMPAEDPGAFQFSNSVAQAVIVHGQPIVSLNARCDPRMANFASVHQLSLEAVVCVPIRTRNSTVIGALYLETRRQPPAHFEAELPTLAAFADQLAIALENARLLEERKTLAQALLSVNRELEKQQALLTWLREQPRHRCRKHSKSKRAATQSGRMSTARLVEKQAPVGAVRQKARPVRRRTRS